MAEDHSLSSDEREDLVAYLDGELAEEQARALEAKLGRDATARAEAEALQQTWELLDYLPRPEPTPSFTHRTLDRVSVFHPMSASRRLVVHWRAWARGLAWAAAILLTATGGYVGAYRLTTKPPPPPAIDDSAEADLQLARDLRLIENKRLYEQVEDLEFLRNLDTADLFGDDG